LQIQATQFTTTELALLVFIDFPNLPEQARLFADAHTLLSSYS